MEGLKMLVMGSLVEALPPKALAMMAAKRAMEVVKAQTPEAELEALKELENVATMIALGRVVREAGGAENVASDYEQFSQIRDLQEALQAAHG